MKQQTAVEYVIKQLQENGNWYGFAEEIQNILDKGIQMEKEQIVQAHYYGGVDFQSRNQEAPYVNDAEYYYNKTYKP